MSLVERWQGLIAEPLQFVRGPSLGACFADELPDEVLQAMQGQARFRQRLEQFRLRLLADGEGGQAAAEFLDFLGGK